MFPFPKKDEQIPQKDLLQREEKIAEKDALLRNTHDDAGNQIIREQKEKMVMFRMWQQEWDHKYKENFQYLSGCYFNTRGELIKDEIRRPMCNIHGAYAINEYMRHQDRNLMNSNFRDENKLNHYVKLFVERPLIDDIFENYEKWEIDDSDCRQIIRNTVNQVFNSASRALGNAERRVDMEVIKSHEMHNEGRQEPQKSFLGKLTG